VDDLEQAMHGQEVIIPPNSPSAGVIVAFIKVAGAPVELLQIDRTIRRDLSADGWGCRRPGYSSNFPSGEDQVTKDDHRTFLVPWRHVVSGAS
jgi:hypothetical protein